jgi:hypothetical protein
VKYKDEWPAAEKRLSALWHGEMLERPCIAVRAPRESSHPAPPPPADDEARWLDPEYRVAIARHQLESTWWGGEAVPSCLLMANWVLCLGGAPHFDARTIWFDTREVDFDRPSPFRHDPESPWVAKHRRLLEALCAEAGGDGFLIGQAGGLPANDLLSMQMGTQEFLLALMDHPDWMAEAILVGARDQLRARRECQAMLRELGHRFWYGGAGWMPFWAPEPFARAQSDVSCMLSPEMFERFVVPELDLCGGEHGALWYHLDGGDARQHLPRLLSLPYMRVIQYTPAPSEPPNGPEHLELYRAVQTAGRIVHVSLPAENVEPLVRELDPALLMLDTTCPSREAGEALLKESATWARLNPTLKR